MDNLEKTFCYCALLRKTYVVTQTPSDGSDE